VASAIASTSTSSSASASEAVSGPRRSAAAAAVAAVGLALIAPLAAYESDQYSHRLTPISDAAPELNRVTHEALTEIAARWRGPEDRGHFAYEIYRELGGLHWVDRIERYAMRSESIGKLPQRRRRSVFRGAPIWATRVNFLFGVGATIRIGDSLVGSDKLGHFVSQGLKYYRSHLAGWHEERIARRGELNERWLFGQLTTSVYSNADLVANWEGYRFYRSLFEDGVVAGKPAIVRFAHGRATLARRFDWRDHVNDYWDEALNPSFLSPALARYIAGKLPEYCDDYASRPRAYVPRDETELAARYAAIGLRPRPELRIDRVCGEAGIRAAGASGSGSDQGN
jgi:hypothetical protein